MARNTNLLRRLVSLTALVCLGSAGQTPEMATHDSQPTFTTRSNLVLVRVVVRDREGHVNGNLQKEDFQLFDKGKAQFISKFSLEKTAARKTELLRRKVQADNHRLGRRHLSATSPMFSTMCI